MAHSFLALRVDLIPQTTKDNVPTFWQGVFSNDNQLMLIDGYNEKRELVHTQATLERWLYWTPNKQEVIDQLLSTAIEYTAQEMAVLKKDKNSVWYVKSPEELI